MIQLLLSSGLLIALLCGCNAAPRTTALPTFAGAANNPKLLVQRLPPIEPIDASLAERSLAEAARGRSFQYGSIVRASFDQPLEELPAPATPNAVEPEPLTPSRPVQKLDAQAKQMSLRPLTLEEVTESVYVSFPAIDALMRESQIAEGKEMAAWGEFDLKLKAESISQPEGFYKNYRNLVRLDQGLMPGGNVFGQYRIGDGYFPIWYGNRETNEGGEFKLGISQPLLRDRALDQRRLDIMQATLRRQQVDPAVQTQLLEFTAAAADAYWSWVAAGAFYDVYAELLRVTVDRNRVFEQRVEQQDMAPIELVQNQRLIAARETKLIEAERKLQQTSIKLSFFLRDAARQPLVPSPALLPAGFPEPTAPPVDRLKGDISRALAMRPEIRELNVLREQAAADRTFGKNLLLPALNATLEASKDVGAQSSPKGDKTPFELEAGLFLDLPAQRRKAQGKIREADGKLAQLAAKRRLVESKITIQLQDAMSALATSYDRLGRARENVRLAKQLENAERQRFDEQDSDLLRVAIQEGAEIEAALLEIEALADYFKAEADYRAALAVDPLAPRGSL